jgi:hypothetical protein
MKRPYCTLSAIALVAMAAVSQAHAAGADRTWGASTNVSYNGSNLSGHILDKQEEGLYVYWKGNQLYNGWSNSGVDGSRPASAYSWHWKSINLPYTIYNLRLYRSNGDYADIF